MKKEKIEELFKLYSDSDCVGRYMVLNEEDFTNAINQAELEWYKELEKKLVDIPYANTGVTCYLYEIQNKIKELENEN